MARILVVDDEDLVCNHLRLVLEAAGHTVFEARDGDEGLRIYRTEKIDLAIVDLVMPEKDGFTTILEMKQVDPELPIVAVTGMSRNKMRALRVAGHLGANLMLPKPFRNEDVLEVVQDALQEGA
jgi:CheY-like chemotaxis protein